MATLGGESDAKFEIDSPAKRQRVDDGQQGPSRKYSGASVYKSKFQANWQKRWPCIAPVKDNPHTFHCKLCLKVGHQGEKDVTQHVDSSQHQRNVKAVKNTQPLSFASGQYGQEKNKVAS